MSDKKERVAFLKTITTKHGPLEKLSLELNLIGQVVEKDGKIYVVMPEDHAAVNKYEKDGQPPRYFLNFNISRYASVSLDEWKPKDGSSQASEEGNDLPF